MHSTGAGRLRRGAPSDADLLGLPHPRGGPRHDLRRHRRRPAVRGAAHHQPLLTPAHPGTSEVGQVADFTTLLPAAESDPETRPEARLARQL
jgi:hypothetical protein